MLLHDFVKLIVFLDNSSTEIGSDGHLVPCLPTPGARVFIDSKAQLTLLGTEMDYVDSKLSSEFVFHNPNVKGTCGCGESFHV